MFPKDRKWLKRWVVLGVLTTCGGMAPANADSALQEGIKEYHAGHYQKAAGLLGEAQPTDYNNAVLHYYLANSYARLNQKPDAIREYKIALAIQPKGQLAEYCQDALRVLDPSFAATNKPGSAAATTASAKQPSAKKTGDGYIEELRSSIMKDAQTRIDQFEKQMDSEITRIRSDAEQEEQMYRMNRFYRAYAPQVGIEAERRIKMLHDEFEHKKKGILADRDSRLQALDRFGGQDLDQQH